MLLDELLEANAHQRPGKLALICGNERLTYAEVHERSNVLAHGLAALGVNRGDRVAIFYRNSVDVVVGIYAALKVGAVFMLMHDTTKPEKVVWLLNNARAKALLTDVSRARALAAYLGAKESTAGNKLEHLSSLVLFDGERCSVLEAEAFDESLGIVSRAVLMEKHAFQAGSVPPKKHIDLDLAALVYTSGSTGEPKGVMLSHRNMVSASRSITIYLENTADDVILNVLPLAFDYGLYQVLMAFMVGACIVLERGFTYPSVVLKRIVEENVTGFPVVPTTLAVLLRMENLGSTSMASLRYITNTGAALPVQHIDAFRKQCPDVTVYSMYGLTECKRVSYLPPEQLDHRPDSVGRGMPNEEVYLVDGNGDEITAPDVVGELVVRGSNVMVGYWENAEATAKRLKPGKLPGERVLHTGDLFRSDAEGYLYFVGRTDDIIKSRGEKVSPREVEEVIHDLDGVAEAAVVGVDDPILGQAIKAYVCLRSAEVQVEGRDVLRHCMKHLEDFMVPQQVTFVSEMPKTANRKIDKRALQARH